jgi:hypothetical protein
VREGHSASGETLLRVVARVGRFGKTEDGGIFFHEKLPIGVCKTLAYAEFSPHTSNLVPAQRKLSVVWLW